MVMSLWPRFCPTLYIASSDRYATWRMSLTFNCSDDDSVDRLLQCGLACGSIRAPKLPLHDTWGNVAPTQFVISWAYHPGAHPKWHLDRFSCFCRAYAQRVTHTHTQTQTTLEQQAHLVV